MAPRTWLTRPEQAAWRKFAAVLELLPAALDRQLVRDDDLTHFDYLTMSRLSEAPQRTLRMSRLATLTNATLPRLSRVVARLEAQGLVERQPCPSDGRAWNAVLTEQGWAKVVATAPGHARTVRRSVFDGLSAEQVEQLDQICTVVLDRIDPDHTMDERPR